MLFKESTRLMSLNKIQQVYDTIAQKTWVSIQIQQKAGIQDRLRMQYVRIHNTGFKTQVVHVKYCKGRIVGKNTFKEDRRGEFAIR